jgi:BirA family transcriptional regulator, biotin operon repressor / biotin---[acetyl-CoA-carboxylase] ligase
LKSSASELTAALRDAGTRLGRLGTVVEHLPATGSTNDVAAALRVEGAIVIADAQTAGRGRRGHTWFSPPGSGLYVSVVLTPARATDAARAATLLTIGTGVAVAEGIERATGLRADLKWPNDLFAGARKLAGILAEAHGAFVVVGYGINLASDAYPPDVRDRATSIESELGRPVDRSMVLVETAAALADRYDDLLAGRFDAILDAWRTRAPRAFGARVEWTTPAGVGTGVTDGIDPDGALRVRTAAGVERIVGGEVRWR